MCLVIHIREKKIVVKDHRSHKTKARILFDNVIYDGEVKGEQPHGRGKLVFFHGETFEGYFRHGSFQEKSKV